MNEFGCRASKQPFTKENLIPGNVQWSKPGCRAYKQDYWFNKYSNLRPMPQYKSEPELLSSQCSLMKRSLTDPQMLLVPVSNKLHIPSSKWVPAKLCPHSSKKVPANKLHILSSMQMPSTNQVSNLPTFASLLSILTWFQDWLVAFNLLR